MPEMCLEQIGVAHTPYQTADDAPHQGFADDAESTLEIFAKYEEALSGIEDVHRVTVVYWADETDRDHLVGSEGVGTFARRTPHRPNPLSICACMVLSTDGRRIHVRGLDAIDGSPIVDLKPALQAER
jgi:tRNA-Thr(GGU) m(6)t(6)A37 methyltransferase TsaA